MNEIKSLSQITNEDNHLTLVIGAGVNKQALGGLDTILTNWKMLLETTLSTDHHYNTGNYILDFEARLVDKTATQSEEKASRIEEKSMRELCQAIIKEQSKSLYYINYPTFLMNNSVVSNIVSLNFDLIPEVIMSGGKIPQLSKVHESLIEYNGSNLRRCRLIKGIKYWHPHGDVLKKDSLIFGMRQYIKNLEHLEVMRRFHKKMEHHEPKQDAQTWYEALVNYPVLVLGASLSDNELDIWGALINRERNFAKGINRSEYRPPVYIMWSECESGKFNKPDWVTPIFSVNQCYDKQWQKLKKLFEEHGN